MGVDRGMGILWDVFTVSGHSVNWDEILEWYLDGPGSSFKESDEFIPGPTFRENVPRQRRHILKGIPFSKGVVTSHKPSSSFMDFHYFQTPRFFLRYFLWRMFVCMYLCMLLRL